MPKDLKETLDNMIFKEEDAKQIIGKTGYIPRLIKNKNGTLVLPDGEEISLNNDKIPCTKAIFNYFFINGVPEDMDKFIKENLYVDEDNIIRIKGII